ncbi:PepSY domain-containing protein [Spirillospora sp. NPDC127200]
MTSVLTGRRLLVTAAAGAVLAAGGAATAYAAQDDEGPDRPPAVKITAERAADAALKAAPGRIAELDLDEADDDGDDKGGAAWSVDVLAADGSRHEVRVDADSGEVLASGKEGADTDSDDADDADDADDDGGGGDAAGTGGDQWPGKAKALNDAKLTAAQAAASALKTAPGVVTSVDFENANGQAVWSVEVVGKDGAERDLTLAPADGRVLSNVPDRDDD